MAVQVQPINALHHRGLARTDFVSCRLVSAPSGLLLEWGGALRAKVAESALVVLTEELAWQSKKNLLDSVWVPPPSLKAPKTGGLTFCNATVARSALAACSLQQMQQAWIRAVSNRFAQEVLRLGLRIFGRRLTLWGLAQVQAHFDMLRARLTEMPHGGPLLALDVGMWNGLHNWAVVKNRFLAQGLTPQAWRWLCHQPRAYVARIQWGAPSHLAWVNVHAAMGMVIPAWLIDAQLAALDGFGALTHPLRRTQEAWGGDKLAQHPGFRGVLRVLRLCVARVLSVEGRSNQRELIHEEWPLIADWTMAKVLGGGQAAATLRRGCTYDTLMAWQSYWHLSDFAGLYRDHNVFWPEVLGMGQLAGDYEFVELSSLRALLQEAKRMHHCVPSYINRCIQGDICLFHVRKKTGGAERATLEIDRLGAKGWRIAQLKGPCNSPVSAAMQRAALQLLQRINPLAGPPTH